MIVKRKLGARGVPKRHSMLLILLDFVVTNVYTGIVGTYCSFTRL